MQDSVSLSSAAVEAQVFELHQIHFQNILLVSIEQGFLVYVVTGASRGLGLEFVRQLSSHKGTHVIACARNIEFAKELAVLASHSVTRRSDIHLLNISIQAITLIEMDVSNSDSIASAGATIRSLSFLNCEISI